jgi:hypothetical protein
MSLREVVVEGTLKPDGTLELDQKPSLSPGRVQVIVKPLTAAPAGRRGLVDVIDEIRRDQLARGYQGRTAEELAADEAERRAEEDDYDRRMQELWAQTQSGAPPEKK